MRLTITITFSFIFIGFFTVSSISAQHQVGKPSWDEVATYDSGLIAPHDLRLVVEGNNVAAAILLDNQAPDQHVAYVRLEDAEPVYRPIPEGRGPAEVSGRGMALSLFSDMGVFLWDHGNRRALIFDSTLDFLGQLRGLPSYIPRDLYLVNDSTVVSVSNRLGEDLFELYRLERASDSPPALSDDPILTLSIAAHASLESSDIADNILLRQSQHRRIEDQLVLGLNYSSITISMSEDGYDWVTDEPVKQNLPQYDYRDGNTITAPRADKFPVGIRGIAGDSDHVYVLYSDQQARSPGLLDAAMPSRLEREMERVMHTDQLLIFDRRTGNYLKEARLPVRAIAIDVREGFLGLIAHEGSAPSIAIYRMPSNW